MAPMGCKPIKTIVLIKRPYHAVVFCMDKVYSKYMTGVSHKQKLKAKLPHVIGGVLLLLLIVALILWGEPLWALFSNPDRVEAMVKDAGPWGPLIFMLMQIAQVFIAPIPGQVTGFIGGYLFGTAFGTLYSMIGAAIGLTLIFVLVRKLGRPFVEYFVDKKMLDKFDYIARNQGVFVLFLIFLLPAFPDDIICFIAGLTKIPIRTLIVISLLGRFPGYLVLSFAGSGTADGNMQLVIGLVAVLLVASALAFWQRARLEQLVKRLAKRK